MDRRVVLAGLLGAASVVAAALIRPARAETRGAAALERWLESGGAADLGDRPLLSRIGAVYLTNVPQESDLHRLSRLLADDASRPVAPQLIEHIARDWDAHRIAVADGWVLSRSEARLCAALHLLDGAPA